MKSLQQMMWGVGLALLGTLVVAQQPPSDMVTLDIPAQPIESALNEFARQAGVQILFYSATTRGIRAPQLAGSFTPEAALNRLLASTSLRYEFINDRTVAIRSVKHSELGLPKKILARGDDRPLILAQAQTESQAEGTTNSSENREAPTLEEIVVTAEKRAERIQDLPVAISAFSGEMLADRGIASIESLQELAPSLVVGNLARGFGTIVTVRGISGSGGGAEPGVGIIQDGVPYLSRQLASVDLLDVERVEVLRGPQGTMSGRNTTGGAIHFHSKRPTEEVEGGFKATVGNYDRLATEGYLSGPIIQDRLLGRVAVRSDRADGWVTNTLLGETLGDIDQLQARASLLAPLTENFEAHLIVEGIRDRSSTVSVNTGRLRPDQPTLPEFYGLPAFDRDRRTLQQDLPGGIDTEKNQTTLKLAWDLGSSTRITAVTGYVEQEASSSQDHNDATAAPALVWGPPEGTPLVQDVRQASQEITLMADLTDRLDMMIGGLYLRGNNAVDVTFGLPLLGVPSGSFHSLTDDDVTSWAGYTQWRYRLTDDIRLTAGVRYTHDTKETFQRFIAFGLEGPPVVGKGSWDAWTPRFAVDYTPTEDLTLYASVARGFTSGGFSFDLSTYDPEIVWNYEVGIKGNWLNDRLSTALTGFNMEYTDLQQEVMGVNPEDALGRMITNADSTISGVEMELEALIAQGLRLTASGTWLDATFGEGFLAHDPLFPELGVPGPVGLNVRDLSGNRLPRAPEWQFNLSGEYRTPLGMLGADRQAVLRLSYFWRDKEYFEFYNLEPLSQDAYGVLNLFAAIENGDGKWQLAAHVNNLTDEFYRTHAGIPSSIAAVRFSSFRLGLPRTYGVSLAYRF